MHGVVCNVTVTYGVDESGNPLSPSAECPYGYKLNWVDKDNNAKQVVIAC